MYIIMGTRSETASCPQHAQGMYSPAHVNGISQPPHTEGGAPISKGDTKLVKVRHVYGNLLQEAPACTTCALLQTCPSPKQSCWLPPHPHPRTSTIIFTAGNSKVVWSFRGWYLGLEITWCDTISDIAKCTRSPRNKRSSSSGGPTSCLMSRCIRFSTQLVSLRLTVKDPLSRSQFVESIQPNQGDYASFSRVQSNPLRDAFYLQWNRKAISLEFPNERSGVKGQADLFHVCLEPELLLCNFLGMRLRRTVEWSPQLRSYWHNRKQTKAAASFSIRQSAGSVLSSSGKQLAWGAPGDGGMAAWEEEDGTEQWQSSGHKTCPTKTQHSPWFTSLPSRRGTERGQGKEGDF